MVVEHEVREHTRDGGDTQVDEYTRGSERKVGRFGSPFKGLGQRFKERQAEYNAKRAEAKDDADLALSREEYLAEQEQLEMRKVEDERRAYESTHRAPLRERLGGAAQSGLALYKQSRGPQKRAAPARRRASSRVPPGYAVYNGKLYRIPKGYSAAPVRRRRRAKPREQGVYGENDKIYK